MKFRTQYDLGEPVKDDLYYSSHRPEVRLELNEESGREELVQVGSVDMQELMNEAAKECSIYRQIDRFNRTGDSSFLGTTVEGFIDGLKMPKSLMEMENLRAKSKQIWSAAPRDVREQYGSNIELFLRDVDKKIAAKFEEKLAAQRAEVKGVENNG